MIEYVPIPLLKWLYPVHETPIVRTRDLKVLCLGLGRTGTESLHDAILHLGYKGVYHGYRAAETPGEQIQWYRLALAKFKHDDQGLLNRIEFDRVIGDCEAVTDLPCAAFGPELLRAYPDAKVVLNRRRDVEAWYQSQLNTTQRTWKTWNSWSAWALSGLQAELFWTRRIIAWCSQALYNFDFERNARQYYEQHYRTLELECKSQGRAYLDWTVEDGWTPLCEFLQLSIPSDDFPVGNGPAAYAERKRQATKKQIRLATAKLFVLCLFGLIALGIWTARKMTV